MPQVVDRFISQGKIKTVLSSIVAAPTGKRLVLDKLFIMNPSVENPENISATNRLLTVILSANMGAATAMKTNMVPLNSIYTAGESVDLITYGELLELSYGTIIQAASDLEDVMEYYVTGTLYLL